MTGTPLLFTSATVITVDGARRVLTDAAVLVEGDRIADIGPTAELRRRHPEARPHDCTGKVLIPGLINTHTHLFQTLLKGLGDDMVLKDWFTCMTAPSAAALTAEDVDAAASHGAVEAVKTGTTTLVDFMYVHPVPDLTETVIRALHRVGIRGIVGRGYMTMGTEEGVPPSLIERPDDALADAADLIRAHNLPDARVQVALAPCMVWTVDEATLRATKQVSDDLDALVMTHVSETRFEKEYSTTRYGATDVEFFERVGLLGPRFLGVHCVHCDADDLGRMRAHEVGVSHNPCSNLYLASGIPPVPHMREVGIPVGLGSDGPASSNNHNLTQAMKIAALLQKGHHLDATIITAEQTLEMATIEGARAVGLDEEIGSIEVGKKADLVLLNLANFCVTPVHNPVSALVYSAMGNEPELVMIDGDIVMSDGRMRHVDEESVMQNARVRARTLTQRAGTEALAHRPWSRPR